MTLTAFSTNGLPCSRRLLGLLKAIIDENDHLSLTTYGFDRLILFGDLNVFLSGQRGATLRWIVYTAASN